MYVSIASVLLLRPHTLQDQPLLSLARIGNEKDTKLPIEKKIAFQDNRRQLKNKLVF